MISSRAELHQPPTVRPQTTVPASDRPSEAFDQRESSHCHAPFWTIKQGPMRATTSCQPLWLGVSLLLIATSGTIAAPSSHAAAPTDQLSTGTFAPKGSHKSIQPIAPPTAALSPVSLGPVSSELLNSPDLVAIGSPVSNLSETAKKLNLEPSDEVGRALGAPSTSSNRPREKPTEPIQTFDIFKTRCTFNIEGKEDGTGIANASLNCSGPGTPVTVIGSNDLDPFAAKFMEKPVQGVTYTHTATTLGAVLQFINLNNVAIINSRLINTGSGTILIADSNMQVLGCTFDSNFGTVAGALTIQGQSAVLIDSTSISNNTATAGGALVIQSAQVAITNSSFVGNANGNSQGGAISSTAGSLDIIASSFIGNIASRGGAIFQTDGKLSINNTRMIQNRATSTGGSLYSFHTKLDVFNSTFSGNTAKTLGGAIVTDATNFTISESIFDLNRAQSQGGAVFQSNSTGNFTACTLSNNTASNGGAIFQDLGAGDITLCLFETNIAAQTGGALLQTNSNSNLINSTFMNNRAGQLGGAALQNNVASSITYCIFQGNSAQDGGGLYRTASIGNTLECSFINNSGKQAGGAMYINNSKGNIKNTLFNGNKAAQGSAILLNTSVPVVTGCLFDNSRTAGNAIYANNESASASPAGSAAARSIG